jgi:hypothetical protein
MYNAANGPEGAQAGGQATGSTANEQEPVTDVNFEEVK